MAPAASPRTIASLHHIEAKMVGRDASAVSSQAAAVAACSGVMAYPLADFTGGPRQRDWTKLRWLPSLSREDNAVDPARFLEILPELLDDVPPLAGEEPLYARLRGLVAAVNADPALAAVASAALHDAEREVVGPLFEFRNVGIPLPAGWTTVVNGAAFGTDYLTRTAVARSNVFVNRHHETKYYYLDVDATGRRLEGRNRYAITFPPGRLPPASGFWSLTAYDARHALPANSTARNVWSKAKFPPGRPVARKLPTLRPSASTSMLRGSLVEFWYVSKFTTSP